MYARWLTRQRAFVPRAATRSGRGLVMLPRRALDQVVTTLETRWSDTAPRQFGRLGTSRLAYAADRVEQRVRRLALTALGRPLDAGGAPSVTLNVGHDGLDEPERFARLPGRFVAMINDLIPITHPEYETERATRLHQRRIATLVEHADHVFTISETTRAELLDYVSGAPFTTSVLHLGPALTPPTQPTRFAHPTFVHLSSIDRRKNLAFLLHVWRELAEHDGAPHLLVIGRRGSDQTALDLIDRSPKLHGLVRATGGLGDDMVAGYLAGARALVTPSFVEGYGLPIVEAHAMGVPVIASDIPAHREIGGISTIFVGPTDGPGWRHAIMALAENDAIRATRVAQIAPPADWETHFTKLTMQLEEIAAR
ncbi:glycosyltransferase family 4 protein [Acuticoccus mangrovi]|uniref:Glycosyltransferase family 4 protein n=1 Tax=Acuticoccus mangrovi TaxID=2796142 RepID=A0A934ICP4_9HYPH|nr:glycosyltransferase family 1 protein [Acuticoccus mangrovi]MBJ3774123.1 glycosyltransferase family 4 protein [Acuticoccus mangrovi]